MNMETISKFPAQKKCPVLFFARTELSFVSYSALNNGMDAKKMMSVRLAASPSATAAA